MTLFITLIGRNLKFFFFFSPPTTTPHSKKKKKKKKKFKKKKRKKRKEKPLFSRLFIMNFDDIDALDDLNFDNSPKKEITKKVNNNNNDNNIDILEDFDLSPIDEIHSLTTLKYEPLKKDHYMILMIIYQLMIYHYIKRIKLII